MCAVCCKVAMDWFLLCSVLAVRLVMNVFITSLAAILREASKLVRTYVQISTMVSLGIF